MSLIDTVNRLIALRGTNDYSLQSKTSTGFIDADNPSKGPNVSTVSHSLLSYAAALTARQNTFLTAERGDVKMYVDPTDMTVAPTTKDVISHATKGQFGIKDIIEYEDEGVAVLYILQLRQ